MERREDRFEGRRKDDRFVSSPFPASQFPLNRILHWLVNKRLMVMTRLDEQMQQLYDLMQAIREGKDDKGSD